MNDERIDYLIAQRNKLTNRRDGWVDLKRVDAIDEKLKQVPEGTRNDVDLLLARKCACIVDVIERHAAAAQKWSSDEERATWKAQGEAEATRLADEKKIAYDDYLTHIADQHQDYNDFNGIKGDLAL